MQAAWLLLLHCASARANYLVRVVEPASAREFCDIHDDRMWQCLEGLQTRFADVEEVRNFGSLPMVLGGIGLRSAARKSKNACWASWGDSLAMIRRRHPIVADQLVHQLEGHPETPFLRAAADTRRELMGVMGVEYKFIQNHFHPKRVNFIQNHFHPNTTFIPKPVSSQTISSKTTFIPKPVSSQTNFIPKTILMRAQQQTRAKTKKSVFV